MISLNFLCGKYFRIDLHCTYFAQELAQWGIMHCLQQSENILELEYTGWDVIPEWNFSGSRMTL